MIVLSVKCPQCGMPMVADTMTEEGHKIPIQVCSICDYWR